ncbi:MAG: hypothetical protein JNL68_07765 [Burkholderiales bacterium]|nr:hypothetical protein [Burkholderiales bacterium]
MHPEAARIREIELDQAEHLLGRFALGNRGPAREAAHVALAALRLSRRLERAEVTRRTFRNRPIPEAHLTSLLGWLRQTIVSIKLRNP